MIPWKLIAGVFVVLIVVSGTFAANIGGVKDLIARGARWLKGSPLGGFVGEEKSGEIDLTLYPETFVLKPDGFVNMTVDSTRFENFKGEVELDFGAKTVALNEADSELKMGFELDTLGMEDVKIGKLVLKGIKLELKSNGWTKSTENGSMEIHGFSGEVEVGSESISFKGDAARIVEVGE